MFFLISHNCFLYILSSLHSKYCCFLCCIKWLSLYLIMTFLLSYLCFLCILLLLSLYLIIAFFVSYHGFFFKSSYFLCILSHHCLVYFITTSAFISIISKTCLCITILFIAFLFVYFKLYLTHNNWLSLLKYLDVPYELYEHNFDLFLISMQVLLDEERDINIRSSK